MMIIFSQLIVKLHVLLPKYCLTHFNKTMNLGYIFGVNDDSSNETGGATQLYSKMDIMLVKHRKGWFIKEAQNSAGRNRVSKTAKIKKKGMFFWLFLPINTGLGYDSESISLIRVWYFAEFEIPKF